MTDHFGALLVKYDLVRLKPTIERFVAPCVAFDLVEFTSDELSRLGGIPYLPEDFEWPANKDRPLDVLLQMDLSSAALYDKLGVLPPDGLLTFFYDLENQPWGYDPKNLQGFKTHYSETAMSTRLYGPPESEFTLPERGLVFRSALSVPWFGSRTYDELNNIVRFTDGEADRYSDFALELSSLGSSYRKKYWGGDHRLLGHSQNVQDDMQLEAQLVTNGLYCGDPSGYDDPRARTLATGADDWVLLLQLDSDETADLMWGDVGMLYFWIKTDDLARRSFQNVWMTLQCG